MSQESSKLHHYHPVTHVVFDCDGLLIDSEVYYYEALAIVAKRYGKEFTFKIKAEMMGESAFERRARAGKSFNVSRFN